MMIKVCGMRDADNIQAVEQLGIDWMGMIFWPKSSRFVTDVPSYLPKQVRRVGVFVDASLEDIRQHVSDYQLDFIQLHGKETPAFAEALKPLSVIKAFNIAEAWRQRREVRLVRAFILPRGDTFPAQWGNRS